MCLYISARHRVQTCTVFTRTTQLPLLLPDLQLLLIHSDITLAQWWKALCFVISPWSIHSSCKINMDVVATRVFQWLYYYVLWMLIQLYISRRGMLWSVWKNAPWIYYVMKLLWILGTFLISVKDVLLFKNCTYCRKKILCL